MGWVVYCFGVVGVGIVVCVVGFVFLFVVLRGFYDLLDIVVVDCFVVCVGYGV